MTNIVCLSGGESSAIVAIEVCRKFGIDDVVLLNHDISSKVEVADVKRFKNEIADYLGLPITYANHADFEKNTPIKVCLDAKTWVNPKTRTILCTSRLKTEPFYWWLTKNYKSGDVCYYGFDASEASRINRRAAIMQKSGYLTDYPLATWENRTISKTMQIGIAPPLQYEKFNHANCKGCLKAGWQHWYVVYCENVDIWLEAKQAEIEIGYSIHNDGYLEDKEPIFEQMRLAGMPPTEKIPSAKFWIMAKKLISQASFFDMPIIERAVECVGC